MRKHIKVIIAEDHILMRESLRQVIGNGESLQLCGEAENGRASAAYRCFTAGYNYNRY